MKVKNAEKIFELRMKKKNQIINKKVVYCLFVLILMMIPFSDRPFLQ